MVLNESLTHLDKGLLHTQFLCKDFKEGGTDEVVVFFSPFPCIMQEGDQFEHRFFIFAKPLIESPDRLIGNILKMIDTSQRVDIDRILMVTVKLRQIDHLFDRRDGISKQPCIGEGGQDTVAVRLVEDGGDRFVECCIGAFGSFGSDKCRKKSRVGIEGLFCKSRELFEQGVKTGLFALRRVEKAFGIAFTVLSGQYIEPYRTV